MTKHFPPVNHNYVISWRIMSSRSVIKNRFFTKRRIMSNHWLTQKRRPIGVFDSGVGGLTTLTKLAELLPTEDLLYLGDTARVPYGNRSIKTIYSYAAQCVEFLHQHEVKLILVACNTVSAVALPELANISSVPIIGVIKPAVAAILRDCQHSKVGIIGTRATITSQAYVEAIKKLDSKQTITVNSMACPLFVPLIEEGWHEHPVTYSVANEYLSPLIKANVDTLVLGCTHYPLLKKVIRDIMPQVRLIDAGEEAAMQVAQAIKTQSVDVQIASKEVKRSVECYMTDMTAVSLHFAQHLLGVSLKAVHQIAI